MPTYGAILNCNREAGRSVGRSLSGLIDRSDSDSLVGEVRADVADP